MEYDFFINSKKHTSQDFGIKPLFIPDSMFDFQKYITEKTIRKGRIADFIDTGHGKTYMELVVAANYARSLNVRVLIIAPIAVAFQHLQQAEKFGIDDLEYSKDGRFKSKIVICNYERLGKFDPNDFGCVILDESSILKNFNGKIKGQINSFIKKIKYRFLFTATPSPNDFTELGTSSEALGYLGYTDMLTKFFTNNEDTISPMNIGTDWILKKHAEDSFFEWVSSWSISMRKPSDLGFSDANHTLPELETNYHSVKNEKNMILDGQMLLINSQARRQSEVREENKSTIEKRCEHAVNLASKHDSSVYWCNLNPEGDLLEHLDKDAYQLKGSMNIDRKEEILIAFAKGEIKKLITKPKMTAFGLNWQHCGHTVIFPTWSYEQFYQMIRRFWRYGRFDKVIADVVLSDGQQRIIDALKAKGIKGDTLFSKLNSSVNKGFDVKPKLFTQEIIKPSFILS